MTALTPQQGSHFLNTNRLLKEETGVEGGKTGFTRRAGYCLAVTAAGREGKTVAAVVLGATTSPARFAEMDYLLQWIFRTAKLASIPPDLWTVGLPLEALPWSDEPFFPPRPVLGRKE